MSHTVHVILQKTFVCKSLSQLLMSRRTLNPRRRNWVPFNTTPSPNAWIMRQSGFGSNKKTWNEFYLKEYKNCHYHGLKRTLPFRIATKLTSLPFLILEFIVDLTAALNSVSDSSSFTMSAFWAFLSTDRSLWLVKLSLRKHECLSCRPSKK